MGLPLLAGVLFVPFMLERLGNERFGVVTLIWALIGYFGLFDMGVGRALTVEISKLRAAGHDGGVGEALHAGLFITLATGAVGAAIMLSIAPYLSHDWLKVSPQWQSDTQTAFQIAALGIIPTTVASGVRGALEGAGAVCGVECNPAFSWLVHVRASCCVAHAARQPSLVYSPLSGWRARGCCLDQFVMHEIAGWCLTQSVQREISHQAIAQLRRLGDSLRDSRPNDDLRGSFFRRRCGKRRSVAVLCYTPGGPSTLVDHSRCSRRGVASEVRFV